MNISAAIESLTNIMNTHIIDEDDPYINTTSFMDSIIEYDQTNNTNVQDFLKTNPDSLNYILKHDDIVIGDRFSHEIFLDKLNAVSHVQLYNSSNNSAVSSFDNENTSETKEDIVAIPERETSSGETPDEFRRMKESNDNNRTIQPQPSNNYWGIPKVELPNFSGLIPKFSLNIPGLQSTKSTATPHIGHITNLGDDDDVSSLGNNSSMDVEKSVNSVYSSTKNIEDGIHSVIFTPSEKMVRDKLITEVSNIINNPDSPESVHNFIGIINKDITQEDLLIDNKKVISNVYKNLHAIPDIESKIAYVNELTEMVKTYITSLKASTVEHHNNL
jgi:hypothetical protein